MSFAEQLLRLLAAFGALDLTEQQHAATLALLATVITAGQNALEISLENKG